MSRSHKGISNAEAHRIARTEGVNRGLYFTVMRIAQFVARILCGFSATGVENVPASGPVVIVPNHKSFWDPFFVALVLPRPVRAMGKAEHFEGPMAKVFLGLGSFPVRRGASDQDALDTARAVLENGDTLLLFPEGTRVRGEGLGEPKRGAARLAIEAHAPLVPVTITGTEKRKWPLPRKVKVTFGTPVAVEGLAPTPEDAAALIGSAWPQVAEEYQRWQTRPSTIAVAAAAVGLGILVAKKRAGRRDDD